ncbi:MAG: polymer-forming cytoskeletal protein [Alphaproteobacteria bacterium]
MAGPATPTQFRPEIPRRVTQIPGAPRAASALDTDDTKKLIVGREIRLSGEITACEKLVVEGRVEANLTDSRIIDIATTGYFKGTAEVEEAIISGEFQGTLTVRGRLFVRATGKVSGELRYGELEIERGGRISGDIDQNGSAAREAGSKEGAVAAEAD